MSNEKRFLRSEEQEDLIINNRNLVRYIVGKMGIPENDFDDAVSIGTIGLIKAAATFDSSKNAKFSTYATMCIRNEIFMDFRKTNKHINDISLDEPIANNDSDKERISRADLISNPDSDFSKTMEINNDFENVINITLNLLNPKERLVMLYLIGGEKQRYISEKLNVTQSYISRLEKKICLKVKSYFDTMKQFKEDFSMKIIDGEFYKITFSSKEIKKFNEIFAEFLLKISSIQDIPDFKVNCNKERVIVLVPADLKSFTFIAHLIKEIDEFSMTFEEDKTLVFVNNTKLESRESNEVITQVEKSEKVTIGEAAKDSKEPSNTELNITEEPKESFKEKSHKQPAVESSEKDAKRENKVKPIRDYMLEQKTFSVKELKQKFPDADKNAIKNAIYLAINKGLIKKSNVRGEYIVEKKL